MYKRIVGARSVSLSDIPVYMEDFDDLEEQYFAKARDPNPMKDARLRGLYEYAMLLKVPQAKGAHVPYRLLAQLAAVAPKGSEEDYVVKRLAAYGMAKGPTPELSRRIGWAAKWALREGRPAGGAAAVSPKAREAVAEFASSLAKLSDADAIQNAAFVALKAHGLKPSEFFPVVYSVLLGSDRGPRLGPYVIDSGPAAVSRALLDALGR
jgi:lysyl-tRNA synthetase class 1